MRKIKNPVLRNLLICATAALATGAIYVIAFFGSKVVGLLSKVQPAYWSTIVITALATAVLCGIVEMVASSSKKKSEKEESEGEESKRRK